MEEIGSWGSKGVSFFLSRNAKQGRYHLFMVTCSGKNKNGRVRISKEQAEALVAAGSSGGYKLAGETFYDRYDTVYFGPEVMK